jgi:hypothetical protein
VGGGGGCVGVVVVEGGGGCDGVVVVPCRNI